MPICQYIKTFILGISLGIERVKTSRVEGSEFQICPFFDKTHHFDQFGQIFSFDLSTLRRVELKGQNFRFGRFLIKLIISTNFNKFSVLTFLP